MTACGRRGKPKAGFPRASTVLGNRKSRDSHIPTAAARRGKVENQKQVSHFPTCCFFFPQNESERRPGGGSLRSRLQAHSWIRKCSAHTANVDFSMGCSPDWVRSASGLMA